MPASEWARLLAQGPTDYVPLPGAIFVVYPDAWTPAEVAACVKAARGRAAPAPDAPIGAPSP